MDDFSILQRRLEQLKYETSSAHTASLNLLLFYD
jgi:hypothetical protein